MDRILNGLKELEDMVESQIHEHGSYGGYKSFEEYANDLTAYQMIVLIKEMEDY